MTGVRPQRDALGIRCRRSVKARKEDGEWGVAWGVNRAGVPALKSPTPAEPDEAA